MALFKKYRTAGSDLISAASGVPGRTTNRLKKSVRRRQAVRASLVGDALEQRVLLSVTNTFVNDNWNLASDTDESGTLTPGDIVTNANDAVDTLTVFRSYGINAFGSVTTSSEPGVFSGSLPGYATINDAIANTNVGGTVRVLDGTYSENIVVNKRITLDGAGVGQTIIQPSAANPGISVTGSGSSAVNRLVVKDLTVSGGSHDGINVSAAIPQSNLSFSNVAVSGAGGSGVHFGGTVSTADVVISNASLSNNLNSGIRIASALPSFDGLSVSNSTISGNGFSGFSYNPSGTLSNTGTNFSISNTQFSGNVTSNVANQHDLSFFGFHGNASLTNVTVASAQTGSHAIAFTNASSYAPSGNITLNGVTVSGQTGKSAITYQFYSDVNNISMTNVDVKGVTTGSGWTQISVDHKDTDALNLGNTSLKTLSMFNTGGVNAESADFYHFASNALLNKGVLSDNYQIANQIADAVDITGLGLARWVSGNVYVTAGSFIAPFSTSPSVQRGINAATGGDTINVQSGTYGGIVTVNKSVTIKGANQGVVGTGSRLTESSLTGPVLVTSSAPVVLDGLEFRPISATTGSPDGVNSVLNIGNGNGHAVRNSVFFSTHAGGGTGLRAIMVPVIAAGTITVEDNLITGTSTGKYTTAAWDRGLWSDGGGVAMSILDNTFTSTRTGMNLDNPEFHVVTGNSLTLGGSGVSFGKVPVFTFSGNVFGDIDTDINGQNPTTPYSLDMSGNSSTALQLTLILGGSGNNTVTGTSGNDVVVGNAGIDSVNYSASLLPSAITATGNSAVAPGIGWQVAGGAAGSDQLIGVEKVVAAGQTYLLVGGSAFATVQDAVNAASAGDIIIVAAGTYVGDINLNKSVSLLGAGPDVSILSGAIGGSGATIQISADNVVVDGFTITREGNNLADWNLALNTAGIAIQGTFAAAEIRNNHITGNRTGVDLNNTGTSAHFIHNNVIDNNRTGMILRNQTDNLTVEENYITDNWTIGVLFLDGSGGTNSPVQQAAGSRFNNNDISDNWYGQVQDRQSGGALLPPGSNTKDFRSNWFGVPVPTVGSTNSAEPGYAAQIPVTFGGTATPPGGQPDILGTASANVLWAPSFTSGVDIAPTEYGFQGDFDSLAFLGTSGADTFTVTWLPGGNISLKINSAPAVTLVAPGSIDLNGLDGNDTLIINGSVAADTIINSAGVVTLNGVAIDAMNIEVRNLNGLGGDDLIVADSIGTGTSVNGGADNDTVRFNDGSGFSGTVIGDTGTNKLDYSLYTTAVTSNFATNRATGTSSISGFTQVAGGSGNDTLVGSAAAETFTGGAGNDIITGAGNSSVVDTLIETADGSFSLTNTSLTGAGTDTLTGIEAVNLTATGTGRSFSISSFTGSGSLTAVAGDGTLNVTSNTSMTISDSLLNTAGKNIALSGLTNASLTGTGTFVKTYAVQNWTGAITLDAGPGTLDKLSVTQDSSLFTLANGSLVVVGGPVVNFSNVEVVDLTGGNSNNTFDLSGYSARGKVTAGSGDDTIVLTKDEATITLQDVRVTAGTLLMDLSGVEIANLTGGASNNNFVVSTWSGTATIAGAGGGADKLTAVRNVSSFVLSDSSFQTLGGSQTFAALSLSGIEVADLTDGLSQNNTFDLSGWTGSGKVLAGGGIDTLVVTKDQNISLSLTLLTATDGLSMIVSAFENALLTGGASNNAINATGFSGSAVIVGLAGNDTLTGGSGRDLIIGGSGNDTLNGGGGDDILIGGATVYDSSRIALDAIMSEWKSANAYSVRVANLETGVGSGPYKLDNTTISDTEADQLFGNTGNDWFLTDNALEALDEVLGEVIDFIG